MRLQNLAVTAREEAFSALPGDLVRLEDHSRSTWFYCRIEDRITDGDLLCSVVQAQSWPALIIEGIRPGTVYEVRPANVLSIVSRGGESP